MTVTEHCVKQSFDFTRVMFSRGNVTEKLRFGRLCEEGERVLDMYAGIGEKGAEAVFGSSAFANGNPYLPLLTITHLGGK